MKEFRKLTCLLCLALAITALLAVPVSAVSKGKLVKEHKYKLSYYKNGKWTNRGIKYHLYTHKYDKHNNRIAVTYKYRKTKSTKLKHGYTTKYKLTYKKGKLAEKHWGNDESYVTTKYKNGIPVSYKYSYLDSYGTGVNTYKARYLNTQVETVNDWEADEPYTVTTGFDIQTKDGYPVKISNSNKNNWHYSVLTFYTTGSKKGLLKKAIVKEYEYDEGKRFLEYRSVFKYSYKMKKGVVKSYTAVQTQTYSDGHVYKAKQTGTFKYTKKKASDKRYCSMINDIVGCFYPSGLGPDFETYW